MNEYSDEDLLREFFRRSNIKFGELDNSDGVNRLAIMVSCTQTGEDECIVFGFKNGKFSHLV